MRNGYQTLHYTFHITSDLDDATLEMLVRTAQERSPVYDVITSKVPVTVRYTRK